MPVVLVYSPLPPGSSINPALAGGASHVLPGASPSADWRDLRAAVGGQRAQGLMGASFLAPPAAPSEGFRTPAGRDHGLFGQFSEGAPLGKQPGGQGMSVGAPHDGTGFGVSAPLQHQGMTQQQSANATQEMAMQLATAIGAAMHDPSTVS
ncbi:MAG TPA: hypothetical protein EYQ64_05150 [Gemmatimonadetes bacterium]|nr:hypothetical protein [Gemmatimonadota bacterium]